MEGKDWVAIAGVVGTLLGTILGGYIQNVNTMQQEKNKAFEARQTEAFSALLNALDKGRLAIQRENEGKLDEARKLNEAFELEAGAAVRKIAIFGDKEVAEATGSWLATRKLGKCAPEWKTDLKTWESMRLITLGKSQSISRDAFIQLTLFCDPNTAR